MKTYSTRLCWLIICSFLFVSCRTISIGDRSASHGTDDTDCIEKATIYQADCLPIATPRILPVASVRPGYTLVESQAWWTPAFGHIHTALAFPVYGQIHDDEIDDGVWHTSIRVVLHHNPSEMRFLRIGDAHGNIWQESRFDPPIRCESSCSYDYDLAIPLEIFTDDALRIRIEVQTPDDKRFATSSDWVLATGRPFNVRGKGWYGEPVDDYAIPRFHRRDFPRNAVSGHWSFRVSAVDQADELQVVLDRSHGVDASGQWLPEAQTDGEVLATFSEELEKWHTVRLDTTQLENGWHSLAVRAQHPQSDHSDCDNCPEEDSHLHGVLKFWFYVENS